MPRVGSGRPHPRLVIFDLDRALIDSRPAFTYTLEEAIAAVTGRRISCRELADEYHTRPWRDALRILLDDPAERDACEALCHSYAARSALKRLLVFDGVGMALDALRAEQIDMAAITRLPLPLARKQVESTGLDRFLLLLAAPPAHGTYDPRSQLQHCLTLLETDPHTAAVVAPGRPERAAAEALGAHPFTAAWAVQPDPGAIHVPAPGALAEALYRRWEGRT